MELGNVILYLINEYEKMKSNQKIKISFNDSELDVIQNSLFEMRNALVHEKDYELKYTIM